MILFVDTSAIIQGLLQSLSFAEFVRNNGCVECITSELVLVEFGNAYSQHLGKVKSKMGWYFPAEDLPNRDSLVGRIRGKLQDLRVEIVEPCDWSAAKLCEWYSSGSLPLPSKEGDNCDDVHFLTLVSEAIRRSCDGILLSGDKKFRHGERGNGVALGGKCGSVFTRYTHMLSEQYSAALPVLYPDAAVPALRVLAADKFCPSSLLDDIAGFREEGVGRGVQQVLGAASTGNSLVDSSGVKRLDESMSDWLRIVEDSEYLRVLGIQAMPGGYKLNIQIRDREASVIAGPQDGKIEVRYWIKAYLGMQATPLSVGGLSEMTPAYSFVYVSKVAELEWHVQKNYSEQRGVYGLGEQLSFSYILE